MFVFVFFLFFLLSTWIQLVSTGPPARLGLTCCPPCPKLPSLLGSDHISTSPVAPRPASLPGARPAGTTNDEDQAAGTGLGPAGR